MGLLFRSVMNLAITLVLLQTLARCTQANPVDIKSSSLASTTPESPKLESAGIPKIISGKQPEAKSQNDDEILETANSMVFRPLFVYRQQQAQRRRIYENRNQEVRRNDASSYYPYKSKKPVRKHHRFPALF